MLNKEKILLLKLMFSLKLRNDSICPDKKMFVSSVEFGTDNLSTQLRFSSPRDNEGFLSSCLQNEG